MMCDFKTFQKSNLLGLIKQKIIQFTLLHIYKTKEGLHII